MSAEIAAERAARGAAWLDDRYIGWADRIDLDELLLSSSCRCVLGQVFRPDDVTPGAVFVTPTPIGNLDGFDVICHWGLQGDDSDFIEEYGFDIYVGADSVTYRELDEAWIVEIQKRQGGGS